MAGDMTVGQASRLPAKCPKLAYFHSHTAADPADRPESPMLEIEQKFAGADFADLEQRLSRLGAKPGGVEDEADQYLNAPDRDFATTGEAFRLRRVGTDARLTYKGPKRPGDVKARAEIEVPLAPGDGPADGCLALLKHLGYRPVAVVRKRRRLYHLERGGFAVTVCLDEVEGLGRFAEVEVLAPEDQLDAARAAVSELAHALGLTRVERRSYLSLLLAAKEAGR
jgi:adenylate cyclase class 2